MWYLLDVILFFFGLAFGLLYSGKVKKQDPGYHQGYLDGAKAGTEQEGMRRDRIKYYANRKYEPRINTVGNMRITKPKINRK